MGSFSLLAAAAGTCSSTSRPRYVPLNDQPNAARVEHDRAPAGLSAVCEGNSPYRAGCLALYMLAPVNFNPDGLAIRSFGGSECRPASTYFPTRSAAGTPNETIRCYRSISFSKPARTFNGHLPMPFGRVYSASSLVNPKCTNAKNDSN